MAECVIQTELLKTLKIIFVASAQSQRQIILFGIKMVLCVSVRISAQASRGAAKRGPAAPVSDDSAPAALTCCHCATGGSWKISLHESTLQTW